MLQRRFGRPCRIVQLVRRPCPFSSSYSVEDIDVRLDDGRQLALVLKDLSRATMLEAGRSVRPAFLYDPRREIQAYRLLLRRRVLGTPAFYGAVADERAARYWLVLERVTGTALCHEGAFTAWQAVAGWLGRFHRRFEGQAATLAADPRLRLIRYDAEFMWLWMERARRTVERGPARGRASRVEAMRWLSARYRRAIDVLAALPPTLIHGELFASNVIVASRPLTPRICALDWETIATGPGLVDLAALASGQWTDHQRLDLLGAYHAALTGATHPVGSPKSVVRAFGFGQLHVAVRMIGWASGRAWHPPKEHAQDWLGEAMRLARNLRW